MVDIYIKIGAEFKKIEQFSDEKISVTSSVQNFNDIGKLFTDYSQSFTIPASKINNNIFSHWYNSDVDNGFDHRKRYDAYIEIDTLFFKSGKLQIEKANKKDGYIENYQITFYGNLTQLKDKFKDDKLQVVFGGAIGESLNHAYTPTEVINRIATTIITEVRYPLIGNNRRFTYKDGGLTDVTTNAGAINWNDLFPAVRIVRIFDMIAEYYGLTFTGTFFNYVQVRGLWMLLKNAELPRAYLQSQIVDFLTIFVNPDVVPFPEMNLTTNIISSDWESGFVPYPTTSNRRLTIRYKVTPTTATLYKVEFYIDGILETAFDNLSGIQEVVLYDKTRSEDPQNHTMYVKVSAVSSLSFTSRLVYIRFGFVPNASVAENNVGQTLALNQNCQAYVPDIKVSDWFMGIVKMFNMVVTPIDETTFHFEPLDLFYESGTVKEASKYIDAMEMDIDKPKLFKAINFLYEKSENVLNTKFRGLFNREYGDLSFENPDSPESVNYEIKLPFENPMWERSTGYNFQTMSLLNSNLQPYTPKPILMYRNSLGSVLEDVSAFPIKIHNGSGHTSINQYQRFSNEINTGGSDLSLLMSLNWGNEVSSWYLVNAPQGLYFRLYRNYIDNLYNLKTRVLKVKGKVTSFFLNALRLKDRLTIRDNRYIINTMTTDLTTNEVNFELINDYRSVAGFNNVGYRYANVNNLILDNTEQEIEIIFYKGGFEKFEVYASASWITNSGTGLVTEDAVVNVTISANASGFDRDGRIIAEFFDKENNLTNFEIPILQYA